MPAEIENRSDKDLAKLIQGCLKGKEASFKEMYYTYYSRMLPICERYTSHFQEAEDLLQDTFLKVFEKLGSYAFTGSFEGWMRQIFVRSGINYYHKQQRKRVEVSVEPEILLYLEGAQNHNPGPDNRIYTQEQIMDCIEKLPDPLRRVFTLYSIEGFSHQEIAKMLHVNEATSRSNLSRAREKLRSMLHKYAVYE